MTGEEIKIEDYSLDPNNLFTSELDEPALCLWCNREIKSNLYRKLCSLDCEIAFNTNEKIKKRQLAKLLEKERDLDG